MRSALRTRKGTCWLADSAKRATTAMVWANSWANFSCSWSRQVSPRLANCPCSTDSWCCISLLKRFRLAAKRRSSAGSTMALLMRSPPRGREALPGGLGQELGSGRTRGRHTQDGFSVPGVDEAVNRQQGAQRLLGESFWLFLDAWKLWGDSHGVGNGWGSPTGGRVWLGIYEFEGKELKLCWGPAGDKRPERFGTNKKNENRYFKIVKEYRSAPHCRMEKSGKGVRSCPLFPLGGSWPLPAVFWP